MNTTIGHGVVLGTRKLALVTPRIPPTSVLFTIIYDFAQFAHFISGHPEFIGLRGNCCRYG